MCVKTVACVRRDTALRLQVIIRSIPVARCEYMAIASLGVLKAGAAYQPLDPTYPRERLAFMLEDAEAQLLIVTFCDSI